jgi:hypothetical protein
MNRSIKTTNIILIAILIIAIILLTITAIANSQVLRLIKINATLNVGDHVGINLDKDKLHFGTVLPGGYAERAIDIESDTAGYLYITTSEELSDKIFLAKDTLLEIEKDRNKTITFYAHPAREIASATYDEPINVYILKTIPSSLTKMLLRGKEIGKIDGSEKSNPVISINITR